MCTPILGSPSAWRKRSCQRSLTSPMTCPASGSSTTWQSNNHLLTCPDLMVLSSPRRFLKSLHALTEFRFTPGHITEHSTTNIGPLCGAFLMPSYKERGSHHGYCC